ncbi:MAG: nuclear transport factor 2 family protein [Acidimicrobiia bacterium]|nr:nuclear transport factor 2 family protein [Acidimicrobiia bacterium]
MNVSAVRWSMLAMALLLMGAATACGGSSQSESEVLEELVAGEKAALDPYFGESDPTAYVARYAEEMSYFDSWSDGKLENQAAKDYLMGFAGTIPPFGYEIKNPSVDLFDDTAVFAFNVDVIDPASNAVVLSWNTTEIHHRTGDGWELVHAHWSQPVVEGG